MTEQEYLNLFNYFFSDRGEYDQDYGENELNLLKKHFNKFKVSLTNEQQYWFIVYCNEAPSSQSVTEAFDNLARISFSMEA